MGERFNSSYGGYTCDYCSTLIWAGADGSVNPEVRKFVYRAKPADVVQVEDKFFCSEQCAENPRPKDVTLAGAKEEPT